MYTDTDIIIIRRLLERYYDGTSTADDEQRLAQFFAEGDVPADMEADRRLFDSLATLRPHSAEADAPTDLLDRITAAVEADTATPPRRKPRLLTVMLRISAVAAAASLVWAIATGLPHIMKLSSDAPDIAGYIEPADTSHTAQPEPIVTVIPTTETKPSTSNASPSAAARKPAKGHRSRSSRSNYGELIARATESEAADNFTEVTDPEEARRIIEAIASRLASNVRASEEALNKVKLSIDTYNNFTKNL